MTWRWWLFHLIFICCSWFNIVHHRTKLGLLDQQITFNFPFSIFSLFSFSSFIQLCLSWCEFSHLQFFLRSIEFILGRWKQWLGDPFFSEFILHASFSKSTLREISRKFSHSTFLIDGLTSYLLLLKHLMHLLLNIFVSIYSLNLFIKRHEWILVADCYPLKLFKLLLAQIMWWTLWRSQVLSASTSEFLVSLYLWFIIFVSEFSGIDGCVFCCLLCACGLEQRGRIIVFPLSFHARGCFASDVWVYCGARIYRLQSQGGLKLYGWQLLERISDAVQPWTITA